MWREVEGMLGSRRWTWTYDAESEWRLCRLDHIVEIFTEGSGSPLANEIIDMRGEYNTSG